jgi:glutamine amidotransferase
VTGIPVRIAVVDHGAGNLVSIAQGLERAGASVDVISDPDGLDGYDGVVLPGVGAMASVMEGIRTAGFVEPLRQFPLPLLGICVGMQVLFDSGDEDAATGLGILPGHVARLAGAPRLPHIGWNDLELRTDPLWTGLPADPTVYFVHSFAPVCDDELVIARSEYGGRFAAAVRRGPVVGTQFHPERSGSTGLRILSNFVAGCRVEVPA